MRSQVPMKRPSSFIAPKMRPSSASAGRSLLPQGDGVVDALIGNYYPSRMNWVGAMFGHGLYSSILPQHERQME